MGKQICLEDLSRNKALDFSTFSHTNFRHMCILSGCDYVSNVAGIGLKKAYLLVKKHRSPKKVRLDYFH